MSLKPYIEFRHISMNRYLYSFKKFNPSLQEYIYRCKFRSTCANCYIAIKPNVFNDLNSVIDSSNSICKLAESTVVQKFG